MTGSKQIHFGGGEVAAHRKELARHGVRRIAFNVHPIVTSRSRNAGDPAELEPYRTVFYSSRPIDDGDMREVIGNYATEWDTVVGLQFADDSPAETIAAWDGRDLEEFYELALDGPVFMDEADAGIERNARALTAFYRRNPSVRVYTSSSKTAVVGLPFVTDPLVTGWVSASRHGELQIWDGAKVRRSPKASRAKTIEKLHAQIESMGASPRDLLDNDQHEAVRLAIRSWLMYETVVANDADVSKSDVVSEDEERPTNTALTRVRQRKLIPVLSSITINPGDETERHVVSPANHSLYVCNSCGVADVCPEYEKGSTCAFDMPIQIRSQREMTDAAALLIELRIKRILRAIMEEELRGEGLNPDLSREFESAIRMMTGTKTLSEVSTTESITITGKSTRGGQVPGGLISQFFGQAVGAATNREINPAPVDAESTEIETAEVVNG